MRHSRRGTAIFLTLLFFELSMSSADAQVKAQTTNSVDGAPIVKTSKKKPNAKPQKTTPVEEPPVSLPEKVGKGEDTKDAVDALYPKAIGVTVSDAVVGMANRIDSFFGDTRSDDERNGSTLRLTPSYTFYNDRPNYFELGVNLNLKLRNLETRAKEFETSIRNELLEQTPLGDAPFIGEIIKPKKEEQWHVTFESRLAARPALDYQAIFRVRHNFVTGELVHHFSISGGWDTTNAWTQKTSLVSDKILKEDLLFRFINEANWFVTNEFFLTTHGPSIIHTVNKYNSVSYNVRVTAGKENGALVRTESLFNINFRHGTPSKRIYLDLIPGFSYPRSLSYKEVRSFSLALEYFFGDLN